jgi:hypothetical protein
MKKKKQQDKKDPINSAVQKGIDSIIEAHPGFANFQPYLMRHIDKNKIEEKIYELYGKAEEKELNKKEAEYFVSKNLTDYISSGKILDEKGKEVILKNGLEEKTGFLHKLFHKSNNGEKYLDNTMEAFQDLHALFQSGEYAKKMPELTESVSILHDMQFLDPALDVLKSHGLIDDKKYRFLKENIYKKVEKEYSKVVSGIEKRIVPEAYQKVAASILLTFGAILLISNMKITGAVIGSIQHSIKGILGLTSMIISAGLFLNLSNKKT